MNETYQCVIHALDTKENTARVFCEGPDQSLYSGSQEYAVLRNDYARFFFDSVCEHTDLFDITEEEFVLKASPIYPDEVKLFHSCYPKNLRRWLGGTVSRKKRCRIEFCVLIWCHAVGWQKNPISDEKWDTCRKQIAEICSNYVEVDRDAPLSFEMIWRAPSVAYEQSY